MFQYPKRKLWLFAVCLAAEDSKAAISHVNVFLRCLDLKPFQKQSVWRLRLLETAILHFFTIKLSFNGQRFPPRDSYWWRLWSGSYHYFMAFRFL